MNRNGENTAEKLAQIEDFFTRGIGDFIDPQGQFQSKLIAKVKGEYPKDIVVKFGVDPTRPDIHLGHAVALHKLRKLQDFGCKIVFLVGDFTARIGDPTGKNKTRPEIEQAEVEQNMMSYLEQVDRIVEVIRVGPDRQISDSEKFSWIRNSDWFYSVSDLFFEGDGEVKLEGRGTNGENQTFTAPADSFIGKAAIFQMTRMQTTHLKRPSVLGVTLSSMLRTMRHITLAQLIERDMFQKRISSGESLFLHEMLYPVLQGIDSLVISQIYGSCDLEIGGTDQTFNMLMGRKVMEVNQMIPQSVLSISLLVGLDGKEKMSKSLDNYIGVTDTPRDMYGKVMSLPDTAMESYYTLATFTPLALISDIFKGVRSGKSNPRDVKMALARQIVSMYHGEHASLDAEKAFVAQFQMKEVPEDIVSVSVVGVQKLPELLVEHRIVESKGEWRRLVLEGAVSVVDGDRVTDPGVVFLQETILKIGKRRFVRILRS